MEGALCLDDICSEVSETQAVEIQENKHWGRRNRANTKVVLDMSNEQQGGQHACILVGDRCMVRNEIACKPNSQITQHLIGHTRGSFFFFKTQEETTHVWGKDVNDMIWNFIFLKIILASGRTFNSRSMEIS